MVIAQLIFLYNITKFAETIELHIVDVCNALLLRCQLVLLVDQRVLLLKFLVFCVNCLLLPLVE